jgi:TonB family protein
MAVPSQNLSKISPTTVRAPAVTTVPSIAARRSSAWEPGILQVMTLVIWLACLAVGLLGMLITPAAPVPAAPPKKPEPPPMQAQVLNVQLDEPPPPPPDATPPPPQEAAIPSVPDLPEVAAPSAAIAFAQPIEGAVRLVGGKFANPARVALLRPRVQRLIYGRGAGRQPKPDYPAEARYAHEEGDVGVRFNVGPEGNVTSAQLLSPCRWPLLNQAALSAVRGTWHFPSGPPRVFDVSIHFHLNAV